MKSSHLNIKMKHPSIGNSPISDKGLYQLDKVLRRTFACWTEQGVQSSSIKYSMLLHPQRKHLSFCWFFHASIQIILCPLCTHLKRKLTASWLGSTWWMSWIIKPHDNEKDKESEVLLEQSESEEGEAQEPLQAQVDSSAGRCIPL